MSESFLKLQHILDNAGAQKKRRRVGRGIGSGRGKTSSRGGKGQTARTGVSINGFQGGQMPITRRFPKRGFTNIHRIHFSCVNIGVLQLAIDRGRLSADDLVDAKAMKAAGILKNPHQGVRVLGGGTLTSKLRLQVAGVSASARKIVEDLGGQCTLIEPFPMTGTLEMRQKTIPHVPLAAGEQKRKFSRRAGANTSATALSVAGGEQKGME